MTLWRARWRRLRVILSGGLSSQPCTGGGSGGDVSCVGKVDARLALDVWTAHPPAAADMRTASSMAARMDPSLAALVPAMSNAVP